MPPGRRSDAVGGGWLGYLSYPDAGADGERPRIPEAAGGWTDCVLRCDRDGVWWYESLSGAALPDWLRDALSTPSSAEPWRIDWTPPDQAAHRAGVLECLEAIAAGEVYQACVCTQFTATVHGSALEFFADAVTRTAPARAAYLGGTWGAVASLSPELFLSRHGATVTSSPIKGTLPLQADPAALRHSVKDIAENIMIVDLVRNDLGRVAVTGSVTVPGLAERSGRPRRLASGLDSLRASAHRHAHARRARGHLPAGLGHRHAQSPRPRATRAVGVPIGAEYTAAQSV